MKEESEAWLKWCFCVGSAPGKVGGERGVAYSFDKEKNSLKKIFFFLILNFFFFFESRRRYLKIFEKRLKTQHYERERMRRTIELSSWYEKLCFCELIIIVLGAFRLPTALENRERKIVASMMHEPKALSAENLIAQRLGKNRYFKSRTLKILVQRLLWVCFPRAFLSPLPPFFYLSTLFRLLFFECNFRFCFNFFIFSTYNWIFLILEIFPPLFKRTELYLFVMKKKLYFCNEK